MRIDTLTRVWFRSRIGAEGIFRILTKIRDRVDTSIVIIVSAQMRYMCIEVTIEIVRMLEQFARGDRFYYTVRGLMICAYGVPISVMNVGLYPYEQDILPAVASALAYSPTICNWSIPSVQVRLHLAPGGHTPAVDVVHDVRHDDGPTCHRLCD
jgi:hypothetical protein